MTTATKAGGAMLPVVAKVYPYGATVRLEWASVHAAHNAQPGDLTTHAPAQATIDELRAEVERLTRELQEMTDDRDSWLQQADDRAADALRFAKESEALKAKQIDVEAVMRLADEYAECRSMSNWQDDEGWDSEHIAASREADIAARKALRASLLGDGGTL